MKHIHKIWSSINRGINRSVLKSQAAIMLMSRGSYNIPNIDACGGGGKDEDISHLIY